VLFASGLGNIGSDHLLDFFVDYAPRRRNTRRAGDPISGKALTRRPVSDAEPASVYV